MMVGHSEWGLMESAKVLQDLVKTKLSWLPDWWMGLCKAFVRARK